MLIINPDPPEFREARRETRRNILFFLAARLVLFMACGAFTVWQDGPIGGWDTAKSFSTQSNGLFAPVKPVVVYVSRDILDIANGTDYARWDDGWDFNPTTTLACDTQPNAAYVHDKTFYTYSADDRYLCARCTSEYGCQVPDDTDYPSVVVVYVDGKVEWSRQK